MATQNINLFQTKTKFQPFLVTLEQYIRISSIILLSIVFSVGILVGLAFLMFGQQRDRMELEKQQLLTEIKNNTAKESLLLMVRKRIEGIDAVLATQQSLAPFIDTTMSVIQSFTLTSFSMGEKNTVHISVKVDSLEEAMSVLTMLLQMEQKKEIVYPILESLSLDPTKIQIGLTYTVVL